MCALDGVCFLRYGHVYDGGGGMEQYLADLNRALLERSSATVIQVQLTSNPANVGESSVLIGRGRLVRVSLFVPAASHEQAVAGGVGAPTGIRRWIGAWRDRLLFSPAVYAGLTRHTLRLRRAPRRAGEPDNLGPTLEQLQKRFACSFVCLHSAGGADTEEVLAFADKRNLPVGYVHHFSNDRLATPAMVRHLQDMHGVAGVSGTDVPSIFKSRFRNLADGIDTDFFRMESAPPAQKTEEPVLFLPARITPAKGQAELIRAAGALHRRGVRVQVVLAGRTDTPEFQGALEELVREEGVAGAVHFVGQLGPGELRASYARATIMAFPTRHHEGLPRVLLECQSMGVPPVVYGIGGTSEGVVDGKTGFLVPLGDSHTFVERLAMLLGNPGLRARMSSAARRFVLHAYSLDSLAKRHEEFYAALAETFTRAPGSRSVTRR
jgi:glycosyltransferase involved in cell wall biosynthesis